MFFVDFVVSSQVSWVSVLVIFFFPRPSSFVFSVPGRRSSRGSRVHVPSVSCGRDPRTLGTSPSSCGAGCGEGVVLMTACDGGTATSGSSGFSSADPIAPVEISDSNESNVLCSRVLGGAVPFCVVKVLDVRPKACTLGPATSCRCKNNNFRNRLPSPSTLSLRVLATVFLRTFTRRFLILRSIHPGAATNFPRISVSVRKFSRPRFEPI